MTTDAIADVVAAITTAGSDDQLTSHVLRHTFGIELSGVAPVTVAKLLGLVSLETSRLCTRLTAADIQQAVDLPTRTSMPRRCAAGPGPLT